jgi:hypothetical protein
VRYSADALLGNSSQIEIETPEIKDLKPILRERGRTFVSHIGILGMIARAAFPFEQW